MRISTPSSHLLPTVNYREAICDGSSFRCFAGMCISAHRICNGFPDCPDKSDEGEGITTFLHFPSTPRSGLSLVYSPFLCLGCHHICDDNHGCNYSCEQTPAGPSCFCPPGQTLAGDGKLCVVVERIEDDGTIAIGWKIGLIAAGIMGALLMVIIALGTIKYHHTKVIDYSNSVF